MCGGGNCGGGNCVGSPSSVEALVVALVVAVVVMVVVMDVVVAAVAMHAVVVSRRRQRQLQHFLVQQLETKLIAAAEVAIGAAFNKTAHSVYMLFRLSGSFCHSFFWMRSDPLAAAAFDCSHNCLPALLLTRAA